jgi:hypothetical protein
MLPLLLLPLLLLPPPLLLLLLQAGPARSLWRRLWSTSRTQQSQVTSCTRKQH